jgi:carboxymethylenebutenolidase
MRGVPDDRASRDLLAATTYLGSQSNVDPKRIGSIGWCMGGGYSLNLAVADPRLKAAVINYGHLASDDATLKKINASILGIFGGQDKGIPVADVTKFESQLKALGKTVDIHIFPDAGHAFQNPNNKQGYRADDAAQARKLTTDFLAKYLKQ